MRSISVGIVFSALLVGACAGGTAPGGSGAPATPGAQPTDAAQPSAAGPQSAPPAQPGGSVATVVLTGGPDAGTYTGNAEPNCSQGLIGPEGWGVQYSTVDVDENGLGSVQIVSAAPGMEDHEDAFFDGVSFLMTVTIGPSLGENSRDYEVEVSDGDDASGTGSAQIQDNGSSAVIRATATTEDGVTMDVTINCASIVRA
jgi:hypothetical protein